MLPYFGFLKDFLNLEISKISKMPPLKFVVLPKRLGKPDRFGGIKMLKLFIKKSNSLSNMFLIEYDVA